MNSENKKDDKQKEAADEKAWWQPTLMMSLKLSGWIVFPVLLGVFVGKWLDKRYGTEPWLFLLSVGAAFLVSMIGLVVEAKREFGKIEKAGKKDENDRDRERK